MKSFLCIICISSLIFVQPFDEDKVWVDDFEKGIINEMPEDWKGRKKRAEKYYRIAQDSSDEVEKYLSVINEGTDMFILKKIKIDLVQYPYINWNWKVNQIPVNGDERHKKTCDVPASVNVVLVAKKWKPKTIKYTWSSNVEKGTITKSPYAFWPSRCDIIVLQSGSEFQGDWITEKRNVLEDYKMLYNKKKVKSKIIQAIVIMSDGDNTHSVSAADYDDIYFSKN
jgi:hypothetical protein